MKERDKIWGTEVARVLKGEYLKIGEIPKLNIWKLSQKGNICIII
jgi:hypothetical protein